MTGLLVALLLSQARGTPPPQTQRPGIVVQEAGTTKGRATVVDFASGATVAVTGTTASVTVTGGGGGGGGAPTTAQYWTGAADGTLSAEKNLGALATGLVLNTGGVPSAYAGATCAAPGFIRVLSASGAATCASLRLDQLVNPAGDTAFTYPSGAKHLWTFTGNTDNAFSIHGDGAFVGSGDLVHIHKTGTGSTAGADALHVEVDTDTTMTGLRVTMANATRDAINTNALVTAAGFVGPLTGNASTATALASAPTTCSAGQGAQGVLASGNATGCTAYVTPTYGADVALTSAAATGVATTVSSPTTRWTGAYWTGAASSPLQFSAKTKVNTAGPTYSWTLRDETAGADRLTVDDGGVVSAPGGFVGALTGTASGNAPKTPTFIVQTADASLTNEQALSSLSTGLVKVTTGTGVLSTAAAGTDYSAGTSSLATGYLKNTTGTGALSSQAVPIPIADGGTNSTATPTNGGIGYGTGTAHAYTAAGTAGQVPRSAGAGAPVWVGVQSCTSSASTTCTITVARSGCTPVCSQSTSVSTTLARAAVSGTTLTCTWPTSGTNTCNCFCP